MIQNVVEKSMTVCDNTIEAENLVDFFKSLGKKGLNLSQKVVNLF